MSSGGPRGYASIIGPAVAEPDVLVAARSLGEQFARAGVIVLCGGLGGVMEAAARGATEAGGVAIGILPDGTRENANPYLTASLPTGIGDMRNSMLVRAGDVVVACGGSWGTLSEIALAIRDARHVISLHGWAVDAFGPLQPGCTYTRCETVDEAVETALAFMA